MLIAILEDKVFRKTTKEAYTKRWTVRCFAYNQNNELVFLRIKGMDALGKRDHLETVGGGVEHEEELEDAIKREVKEEIGYNCEIVENIGYVVDHYNLLNRETISTYFIVKLKEHVGGSRSKTEEKLIHGLETYKETDALYELSQYKRRTVDELVQRRDLIALKHYMKKKEKR